uniref:Aminoadipate-semialdehyde dehydrogenase n=1 Tax=Mandrillus leucophaeus TaxID=9568 RepID=A0A2K5ZJQ3_MANLE
MVSKDASVKEYIFKELHKYLPSHAIPDELVLIDSLPFTSHGKIDVSELNKIYLNYINLKSENKLSGKEDLWEKLQYLWKSTLNLPEDLLKVPDESLFLNSGGDSLKSIRLLSEIEKLVGTSVPGLLEIILSSSILEIYNHILQTVFPDEDVTFRKSCATKRKLSDINQEEASGASLHQKAIVTSSCHNEINAFVALSRGSQILSLNTTRFSTKLGHCSSAYPSDSVSQTNIQNVKDLNSPVLIGKSKDPSCVVKVSEEGKPVIGTQKMELHVRWRSDTGKCVDASPLVVIPAFDKSSTTVYIGSHSHRMKAVDFYSGKVKWEQLLGDRIESSACVSKCGNFIVVEKEVCLEVKMWRNCLFLSVFEPDSTSFVFCYIGRTFTGCKSCYWEHYLETFLWKTTLLFPTMLLTVCLYWLCRWEFALLYSLWRTGLAVLYQWTNLFIPVYLIIRAKNIFWFP